MDDQGLKGGFQKLSPKEIDLLDRDWLEPITGVPKVDYKQMVKHINEGTWSVWRLPGPAQGIAVAYPKAGRLFIYYLRGRGLFGRVTQEDLLKASRAEGLNGCAADTKDPRVKRILTHLGFKVIAVEPGWWSMELSDGRTDGR